MRAISKCERIKGAIRRALGLKKVRPGARMPSIRKLAGEHRVSVETAARAVRELTREGLLETRPGLGTFVLGRPSAKEGTAVLRIGWGQPSMGELCSVFLDGAIERFSAAHAGVSVETVPPGGGEVDVSVTTGSYVQADAEEGRALPLDGISTFDPAVDSAPFAPEGLELYERSGHLYGLPYYVSPVVIWLNAGVFREAGIDIPGERWDRSEFRRVLGMLQERLPEGVSPFALTPDLAHIVPWILQSGRSFEQMAGAATAGDWKFLREVAALSSPDGSESGRKAVDRFADGRAAMCPWAGRLGWEVRRSGGPEITAVPYPAHRERATFMMSEAFVISSRCTEPELALELVRELVSPASQADVVAEGIRFPSRRDAVAGMLGAAGAAELENHWRERLYARSDVMRLGAVRVDVLGRALRPLWGSNEALGPALTKAAAVCEAVFASYHESAAGPGRLGGRL